MSLAGDLERIEELHRNGSLTDDEFNKAKAELLGSGTAPAAPRPERSVDQQTNQWAMILHISLLAGIVVPFGGLIAPIIIWAMKKDELPGIRPHWVNVANWMISEIIYGIVGVVLVFVVVGIFALIALAIAGLVFPIVAGLKASNGEVWKYPLATPFLKE